MKQQNNDKLKALFKESPSSEPSMGFESRLMRQIKIETEKRAKRIRLYNTLWLGGGIAAIVAIVSFICWYGNITFDFPEMNIQGLDQLFSSVHLSTPLIAFGALVLLLLMGDTLIRKKIEERNSKKQ